MDRVGECCMRDKITATGDVHYRHRNERHEGQCNDCHDAEEAPHLVTAQCEYGDRMCDKYEADIVLRVQADDSKDCVPSAPTEGAPLNEKALNESPREDGPNQYDHGV